MKVPVSIANLQPTATTALIGFDRDKWNTVTLGDVSDDVSVRIDDPAASGQERFVGLEHFDSGQLKIRRWGSTENLESSMKAFSSGDVLFARRNAYLKRASLAEFDGLCSGDAIVLRERHGVLVPGFLALLINTNRFWEFAIANAAGTMSRRVNGKTLMRYEFDLPPLDQQRHIAEILWAADEHSSASQAAARAAASALETFTEHSLQQFTENCKVLSLAEIIMDERPLCYGIVQPGDPAKDGVPFIRVCDMEGDTVNISELVRVSAEVDQQYRRSRVITGDVLVSIVGTIGRVAVVGQECSGFNIARAVARITPNSLVHPEFLACLLRSPSVQRRLIGDAFESARKTLNLAKLAKLTLPVPEREAQEAFLGELSGYQDAVQRLTDVSTASSTFGRKLIDHIL
jgi:type I restriction enzyme S subunit